LQIAEERKALEDERQQVAQQQGFAEDNKRLNELKQSCAELARTVKKLEKDLKPAQQRADLLTDRDAELSIQIEEQTKQLATFASEKVCVFVCHCMQMSAFACAESISFRCL
jgi:small-conductance mechanosensitive channel